MQEKRRSSARRMALSAICTPLLQEGTVAGTRFIAPEGTTQPASGSQGGFETRPYGNPYPFDGLSRLAGERDIPQPQRRSCRAAAMGRWRVGMGAPLLHCAASLPSPEFAMTTSAAIAPDSTAFAPLQEAILGGGCFWCLEAVYNEVVGVHAVQSGYAGGTVAAPD